MQVTAAIAQPTRANSPAQARAISVEVPAPEAQEIPADSPLPSSEAPSDGKEVKRELLPFDPREEVTITRTWDKPLLESKKMGSSPSDYYEHAWGWPTPGYGWYHTSVRTYGCYSDTCENGPVSVYRDVPVYDESNEPRKEPFTQTLTEKSYDQKKSFFVGGGLGLALGAGAALGGLALFGGASTAATVAGGVLGGVLGGAAGAAIGYKTTDNDRIAEVWYQDNISHPTMTGYTERITPDVWHEQRCHNEKDSQGNDRQVCETWSTLRGYDHDFYPNISWRKVGDYTYPRLEHTAKIGPNWGGALAAGAGLGIGALVAVGLHFLPLL